MPKKWWRMLQGTRGRTRPPAGGEATTAACGGKNGASEPGSVREEIEEGKKNCHDGESSTDARPNVVLLALVRRR